MIDGNETLLSYSTRKLFKRTLWMIMIVQIFGGMGIAAGITVGALLAQEMMGTDDWAGLPLALFTLGSATAAYLIGRFSQQYGRRGGLAAGFMIGGLGAVGTVTAAVIGNMWLLFISLFIHGAGTAANLQARYAGTDLALPNERAKAVSMSMVSTTLGAVAGPNLVEPLGIMAQRVGLPPLTGPFLLAAAAYIIAGLLLWALLRPDPYLISRQIVRTQTAATTVNAQPSQPATRTRLFHAATDPRGVIVGLTVMVLTQFVMIAIMTMTPIHMQHHGHSLSNVGLVIGIHIACMYLPSLITGALVDRVGRKRMSIASGVILLAAGIFSAMVPGTSLIGLILALALLGFGWNLGLISGTAMIIDATPPETRARTQGATDVIFALSGAAGGALSSIVVAGTSYAILSLGGAVLSLALIPMLVWARRRT